MRTVVYEKRIKMESKLKYIINRVRQMWKVDDSCVEHMGDVIAIPTYVDCSRMYPTELFNSYRMPSIKNVIFNDPTTIVFWNDGTKTIVKAQDGDIFDPEKGLAMAISKKALGNKGNYYEMFKKWLPEEES